METASKILEKKGEKDLMTNLPGIFWWVKANRKKKKERQGGGIERGSESAKSPNHAIPTP